MTSISCVPTTRDVQLYSHTFNQSPRASTSLCHGMAILLHCSLLLMLLATGNWSDQLMERLMRS